MTKLLEALTDPLVRRLDHRTAGAALAFWAAGLLLFALGSRREGLSCAAGSGDPSAWCDLVQLGGVGAIVLVIAALSILVGSGVLVAGLTPRALQLLAGSGLPVGGVLADASRPLRRWAIRGQLSRRERALTAARPTPVGRKDLDDMTRKEARLAIVEYSIGTAVDAAATNRLRRYPTGPDPLVAPTRMGNALAAAAERVHSRHGIDLGICWELMLANLPDTAYQRLAQESARVIARGQGLLFAVLAIGWSALTPNVLATAGWVVLVAALVMVAYAGVCDAVESYCDLIEATLITHRHHVYHAVGVALPERTLDERGMGEALTEYVAVLELPDLRLSLGQDS